MENLILATLDSLTILKQYLDCPDDRQRITRIQKELVYILRANHGESNDKHYT
jgi:hypothetical protein